MIAAHNLPSGHPIDQWIVRERLGHGGMGCVYLCHSAISENIRAAVKVLTNSGPEAEARFVREAEAIYTLRHPGIVRVAGFGRTSECLYLAMEFVDGHTLDQHSGGEPLDPDTARDLFLQIARALAHAHAQGIYHRDIKPQNIMVSSSGQPIVVDFGIAASDSQTTLTTNGLIPGTMAYLPPEVFEGDTDHPGRADVYALGLVLHQCVTGNTPFQLSTSLTPTQRVVQMMALKQRTQRMDPGADKPAWLRHIIGLATEADAEQRLPTMEAFIERLEASSRAPEDAAAAFTEWIRPATPALPPRANTGSAEPPVAEGTPVHSPPVEARREPPPAVPTPPVEEPAPRRRSRALLGAGGLGIVALGAIALVTIGGAALFLALSNATPALTVRCQLGSWEACALLHE